MEASTVTVRVRYAETDRMGVAYYGNYFAWFEVGRVEMLRELGFTYAELEDEGTLLPVAYTQCKYHSPARYDEEVTVGTSVAEFGKGSIVFETEVRGLGDGRLIADGRTKLGCVNAEGKPSRLPAELLAVLKRRGA